MAASRILSRILYPPRLTGVPKSPSPAELEAWVGSAESACFRGPDEEFVRRALGLGVGSGMLLDLDSRLGLVAMRILWEAEDLLAIGIYSSLEVAERARLTAEAWGLGDRMFFQVGDARDLGLKTGYFDMVISDGILQKAERPREMLAEVARIAKPGAAVLLGHMARPMRLGLGGEFSADAGYPEALRPWRERLVHSGFTRVELEDLVRSAGLERAKVLGWEDRLFVERPGTDDPTSWVSERERYR